ncbi:MAG TPA: glycerophosphodiester phosphodiesterase family protein [Allosphingosinicella sp.]|nr:glycerophosphodiester phosphodiesterase family protein [Allosphingosinicella sp.]
MRPLHVRVAVAALAGATCAGLPAKAPAGVPVAAPLVRPGFYSVAGGRTCRGSYGPLVFLPQRGDRLIRIGGHSEAVSLRPNGPTSYLVVGSDCTLSFDNNDLRTLGLCTRVLAHRGDTRTFPANTLPAFRDALTQGFAGFELDVRFSRNGVAIVSHDDNLAVATDCRGRVAQRDAGEIAQCRAVRTPLLPESRLLARRASLPAPVPTLRQVLEHFLPDPRVEQIVVDIKVFPGGPPMVAHLAEAVPGCPGPDCLSVQQRLTFITQSQTDAALLHGRFLNAHVALESNETVSGLIDEADGDHWWNRSIDTYSLSFNSLFDIKLKIVKLVRGENLAPARRFRRFYALNRALDEPRRLLGWTINNRAGVRGLRDYAFADVLTDMRYADFVRELMAVTPAAEIEENVGGLVRGERRCRRG